MKEALESSLMILKEYQKLSDYPVGWTPHMKGVGMLVVSLRGEIFGI